MEIFAKILEWSLLIISGFLLLLFAFCFLLIEELNNYCKKEVDKDEYEKRAARCVDDN